MSAQIIAFMPRRNKPDLSGGLHQTLGFDDFSAACQKLAESLRGLTEATRDAAAKLRMVKDGADTVAIAAITDDLDRLDRVHAEFVRSAKR